MTLEEKRSSLLERLAANHADYEAELLRRDRQELIDGADRIAETTHVFEYLTKEYAFGEEELDYLLQFQNPLEVLADHWMEEYALDLSALRRLPRELCDLRGPEQVYAKVADGPQRQPEHLRRFENVDVLATLEAVIKQNTARFQSDFKIDKETLRRAAVEAGPEGRSFLWVSYPSGTHLYPEREVFLKDTGPNYTWAEGWRQSLLYAVEISGLEGGKVKGTVYELDPEAHKAHVRQAAIPSPYVTIDYADGRSVDVSHREYDTDRNRLMSQSGMVSGLTFHPEDESVLRGVLRQEHRQRERLPRGNFRRHLLKLADSRIQREADRLTGELQKPEKRLEDGQFYAVPLSDNFLALADQEDIHRLFERLPFEKKALCGMKDQKGQFAFAAKTEVRDRAAEKPSIRAALKAGAPVPGERRAHAPARSGEAL